MDLYAFSCHCRRRFEVLAPLAKLALWALAILVSLSAMQLSALLLGVPLDFRDRSVASVIILLTSLFWLLLWMASENRPGSDYGLVAERNWLRRGAFGFLLGAGFYVAYLTAIVVAGGMAIDPVAMTPYRGLRVVLAAASSLPLAVTQQLIFAGFLVGVLRLHHGRAVSVVVPAMLFAMAAVMPKMGRVADEALIRMGTGLFLVASLLHVVRLATGTIAVSSGLLAGCLVIRRVVSKSRFLVATDHAELDWWAPSGDPRQAPFFWLILLSAIAVCAMQLIRRGDGVVAADEGTDRSFKRLMPFSNLMGFAPIDVWVGLLLQAKCRIGIPYLPRLAMTLVGSVFNTIVSFPERIIAPWVIRHQVESPVFIIGMPRSGTTYLHQLMSLDPRFRPPRNYEVFNPHGFLTGWLTTFVMAPLMTWRRPMDSVQMHVGSPQEEEFALAMMGNRSPYWMFPLPRQVASHHPYWLGSHFSGAEEKAWQSSLRLFLRKITFWRRRRPLLKNPANTGRIALLKETFPDAKFVHIRRNPFAVYRSNCHLAREGLVVFQLQDPSPDDSYETRIPETYRQLMDAFYQESNELAEADVAEVSYEEVEADPKQALRKIYAQLGISMTTTTVRRIDDYLAARASYRKNQFRALEPEDRQRVIDAMGPYFDQWGYDRVSGQPIVPVPRAA